MDELIDLLLGTADAAHKQHFATARYSEHMALGSFYQDLRDTSDRLCEALVGMGKPPAYADEPLSMRLKADYRKLMAMRGICDGDPSAEALFDEVGATFLSAIYKLDRFTQ